jgi:hypothetical protein
MTNILKQKCIKCFYFFPAFDFEEHINLCQSTEDRIQCQICNCDYHVNEYSQHSSVCTGFDYQVEFISEYSRKKYSKSSIQKFLKFLYNAYDNNISGRDVLRTMNEVDFYINDWISFENVVFKFCPLCQNDVPFDDLLVLSCVDSHNVCYDCLYEYSLSQISSNLALSCPHDKCKFLVPFSVLQSLPFPRKVLNKLVDRYNQILSDGSTENSKGTVSCPDCNHFSSEVIMTERQNIKCEKCEKAFCSMCRGNSHYRTECEDIAKNLQEWVSWCTIARKIYFKNSNEIYDEKRNIELQNTLEKIQKFENENEKNLHYCPKCGRITEYVLNFDEITCGQIDNLGNFQNGCGHKFSLNEARPYVSKLMIYNDELIQDKLILLSKVKALHSPFQCDKCKNDIIGARFECLNCECVNFCEICEKEGTIKHDKSHVFRIYFRGNKNLSSSFLSRCILQ